MRLKQKTMTSGRDHYITTDDFTEIRENFIRGMRKYLIMGSDTEPGGDIAIDCADVFSEFFSTIAARPDYTIDWPSYRGFIIETYSSWIGRRSDEFGLIFDEQLFHKYKMRNLVPTILAQLRQPNSRGAATAGTSSRGRGRDSQGGNTSNTASFRASQSSTNFCCYLCGEAHSHKEHQGDAKRLIPNDQGKWIDKQLGNRIVCIAFNVSA
jgi:hypothetical protein